MLKQSSFFLKILPNAIAWAGTGKKAYLALWPVFVSVLHRLIHIGRLEKFRELLFLFLEDIEYRLSDARTAFGKENDVCCAVQNELIGKHSEVIAPVCPTEENSSHVRKRLQSRDGRFRRRGDRIVIERDTLKGP